MSATGRGADRIAHDAYNTKLEDATRIVNTILSIPDGARILEPSAGEGHFVRALRFGRPKSHIEAIEIRPGFGAHLREAGADLAWCADFLTWRNRDPAWIGAPQPKASRPLFDWIVGNPPYARETDRISSKTGKPIMEECVGDHVTRAMRLLRPGGTLAFLLRLGWYAPKARDAVFAEHNPKQISVLKDRPGFFEDSSRTDAATYAVFQFERGWRGVTAIERV